MGLDIGFSIQPLIERWTDGSLHPAIFGAAELAKALERRFFWAAGLRTFSPAPGLASAPAN